MKLEELQDECRTQVVGTLIYDFIQQAFKKPFETLQRRLGEIGYDEHDAFHSALEYLITQPEPEALSPIRALLLRDTLPVDNFVRIPTVGAAHAYLAKTIRNHLLQLLPRDYSENLVNRAIEILCSAPYVRLRISLNSSRETYEVRYFKEGKTERDLNGFTYPNDQQIERAAGLASVVPKLPQKVFQNRDGDDWRDPNDATRRSKVYDEKSLATVVKIMMDNIEGLSHQNIRLFFKKLLTNYAQSVTSEHMRSNDEPDAGPASLYDQAPTYDVDQLGALEIADAIWNDMTENERLVFRMRCEDLVDDAIADAAIFNVRGKEVERTGRWVFGVRKAYQEKIRLACEALTQDEADLVGRFLVAKVYADEI